MVYPATFRSLSTGVTKSLSIFKAGINSHGFLPNHISCRQKTRTKNTRTIESENPCKQFTTVAKLFSGFHKKTYGTNNKISVIGVDEMGIAIAFALLAQKVTSNLCLIDLDDQVLKGEHIDLELGALYHSGANIVAGKDPALTVGSKICIILTGTYQGKNEPESTYITRNIAIMKALLPPIVKYNPETMIVIASDPVDILSYVSWKISGFPKNRVIGLGTLLDTARFRCLLSQKMGISAENCHGYIIGERGENSVPVWSSVNIAGIPLMQICPKLGGEEDNENWQELHKEVVNCDQCVRAHKGYSAWSLALALAHLCDTIFNNSNKVLPVSTYAQGEHNIMDEVYLSLPCVIGENGVSDVLRHPLSDKEEGLLRACASNIAGLLEPALKA